MMEQKTMRRRGSEAEQLAADYLVAKGYAIRKRNWQPHPQHMEVDIIAQDGATMVFVEVKQRTDEDLDPAEAVNARKMRLISRAADIYLRMQPHLYYYRFDIIAINGNPPNAKINHIEDAFMAPLTTVGPTPRGMA